MKTKIVAAVVTLFGTLLVSDSSKAATNPCLRLQSTYNAYQRNVERWANEVVRQQDEAYRLEERIQVRLFDLQFQIADANAYAEYIKGVNSAEAANCGISFFFSRNVFGCAAAAARNAINRNRAAQYRIQNAQNRYNLYLTQAAGLRQRQNQRIVNAQNFLNAAAQQSNSAAASLNSCTATYGAV